MSSGDTSASGEARDKFCNPCHEVKGQFVTSLYGYCTVCENYLCTSCKEMHDHFPATRNHKILTGSELSGTKTKALPGDDKSKGKQVQSMDTVPEVKPKGTPVSHTSTTVPENLNSDGNEIVTVNDALSKLNIEPADSSVPQYASVLDKLDIKFGKLGSFNVKIKDDKKECWITGIAVTKAGKILLADNLNEKLKVFSKDMNFLSSLTLAGEPWDVSVFNDSEAAVSVPQNEQIHIVDISASKPRIKKTLDFKKNPVYGITAFKDSLIVACPYTSPPSVRKINRGGTVIWASAEYFEGRQLFTRPWYAVVSNATTSSSKGPKSHIVVTDCDFHGVNPRLVVLDCGLGTVKGFRRLDGKNPYGICVDPSTSDFIYVCNSSNEVTIMSQDLTEERVILTEQDGLIGTPQAIAYDSTQRCLILSYANKTRSQLDCFQFKGT